MIELGVNIDHVATIRQARRGSEPDPVWAAVQAELAGADGITFHLREDRRHMQDHDILRLKSIVQVQLNFELAAVPEIIDFACKIKPDMAMLVPEKREEVTTEGGLNVVDNVDNLKNAVDRLHSHGIRASAFIDADISQIQASSAANFDVCEIHTGPYALAFAQSHDPLTENVQDELLKVKNAVKSVVNLDMQCNAGHGLNYKNVQHIAAINHINELHIGHSIISRAVFAGIHQAVFEMKRLMTEASLTGSDNNNKNK